MCLVAPLRDGTTCSFEATCKALDCGSATSLHEPDGCLRIQCRSSSDCAAGERCLPAPVAGEIRDCWPSGCESCEESEGACNCSCFDDCSERAVCVSARAFPEEDDCPTAGFTCSEVRSSIAGVEAYIESAEPPFRDAPLALLESCREKLLAAEPGACDFCENWNGGDLAGEPQTPSAAVARWSPRCDRATVGIARGCDLTVVFSVEGVTQSYLVYDQNDALLGRYFGYPGTGGCDITTERDGTQIACTDDIADWCDPTLRQLFQLDDRISCPAFETCKVCGTRARPVCEE